MGHFVSKESLLYFKQKLDTIFAKKRRNTREF